MKSIVLRSKVHFSEIKSILSFTVLTFVFFRRIMEVTLPTKATKLCTSNLIFTNLNFVTQRPNNYNNSHSMYYITYISNTIMSHLRFKHTSYANFPIFSTLHLSMLKPTISFHELYNNCKFQ